MFGNSAERRVAREVDRIISMKEDVDAVSWDRVQEIAKQLVDHAGDDAVIAELARELTGIASSNISLASYLGIDVDPTGQSMASGVEVLSGGMAQAAFAQQEADSKSEAPAPAHAPATLPAVASSAPTVASSAAPVAFREAIPSVEPVARIVNTPPTIPVRPAAPQSLPVLAELAEETFEPEPAADAVTPRRDTSEDAHNTEAVAASDVADADTHDASASEQSTNPAQAKFARFRSLYESRDGALCIFEDEHGHLVSVDTSKFA